MQNTGIKTKSGELKGRALLIYLDLCRYVDKLPPGSPLPSLRELQHRYTAGQQTITAALKHLSETRSILCRPRRKARLCQASTPVETPHAAGWASHHDASVILGIDCTLAPIWQTIIERFNKESSRPVRPYYTKNLQELVELARHSKVDFALFHVNPISQGILNSTLPFVDLGEFVKMLDRKKYYPSFQMTDPTGRNWGISVTFTMPVLFGNRKYSSFPCREFTWQKFLPYLREIKKAHKDLLYPFTFNGYFTFLIHEGVKMLEPETGEILFSEENFSDALQLLKSILDEKMAPLFSETYYDRAGQRWFENGQIAAREDFHSNAKKLLTHYPDMDLLPTPAQKGLRRTVYSEFFTICNGSMYYNTAWDFIKFSLSPETQRFLVTESTMMPALKNIRPPHLTEQQFEVMSAALEQSAVKPEEYYLPVPIRFIMETEIDRWVRFNGNFRKLLPDLERICRHRMHDLSVFSESPTNKELAR